MTKLAVRSASWSSTTAVVLAAMIGGCVTQPAAPPPQSQPQAQAQPQPQRQPESETQTDAPLATNIWSSPGAIKPFVLTDSMIPPGGMKSAVTGGVAIHGLKGSVSYSVQPGGQQILVANKPDLSWPDLTLENSWTVGCWAHTPTGKPHCDVTLLQTSKTKSLTGVSIIDDKVCPSAGLDPAGYAYAALMSGYRVTYWSEARQTEAMHCLTGADSTNALTEMLNEPRFYVFGDPYGGRGTEVLLFPFGLREALAMRDWLKGQMASAKPPQP